MQSTNESHVLATTTTNKKRKYGYMPQQGLLAWYYKEEEDRLRQSPVYPVEQIAGMLTMNRQITPYCRQIGVQYQNSHPFYPKQWNRLNSAYLRSALSATQPLSLHMNLVRSLRLSPEQWMTKRPRIDGPNAKLQLPWYEVQTPRVVQHEKELVFDIDVTDYTRFCACREISRLCQCCWLHIEGAYLILDHLLQQFCGYDGRHLLWVFSGKKGIHCFVNAPLVLNLSQNERMQLYQFLHIGPKDDQKLMTYLHRLALVDPLFMNRVCDHFYSACIVNRQLLCYETFRVFCLESVLKPLYTPLYQTIALLWQQSDGAATSSPSPHVTKWQQLLSVQKTLSADKGSPRVPPSCFIAFRLFYPQIDRHPLALNHLIKMPFSVHAVTGNIALPLPGETILRTDVENDFLTLSALHDHVTQNNGALPVVYETAVGLLSEWNAAYPTTGVQ